MPIQYDREKRVYYNDVDNRDLTPAETREYLDAQRGWINPDGTTNDIP